MSGKTKQLQTVPDIASGKTLPTVPVGRVGRLAGRVALRRAGGFTTVELMIVVGVIALLATLIAVGLAKAVDRMRGTSTRQTLGGLKAVLSEAEQVGILKRQPRGVFETDTAWRPIVDETGMYFEVTGASTAVMTNKVADFWQRPDARTAGVATPVPAPASVTGAAVTEDSMVGKNTAIALTLIRQNPGIAKTLDGFAEGTVQYASFWNPNSEYLPGARVLYSVNPSLSANPLRVYVAKSRATAGQRPDTNAVWALDYAGVKDSWGRPILFVPGCGVAGITTGGVTNFTVKSPDGKPFWMSAGPDGAFDKGDDNLYSFEN